MIITTTPSVEGQTIEEYLGVVTGEAILGAHVGRDIMASLTDIVGGRSAAIAAVFFSLLCPHYFATHPYFHPGCRAGM